MTTINNGGPAFPTTTDNATPFAGAGYGMTLRDYFAAKAMQGMLSSLKDGDDLDALPEFAYELADAMLKAREVQQ